MPPAIIEGRGDLAPSEPHPVSPEALRYLTSLGIPKLTSYLDSYASCAIEGNRLGEICAETLERLLSKKPVSDRYLLGLAWSIKLMEESNK